MPARAAQIIVAADKSDGLAWAIVGYNAGRRNKLDEALRAYHWLNRMAIGLLEPGGILVTCSCSGLVSRDDFLEVLVGAAQQAGRHLQVLQMRGASPDHPVAVNCLEGEYLKCVIARAV